MVVWEGVFYVGDEQRDEMVNKEDDEKEALGRNALEERRREEWRGQADRKRKKERKMR